MRLIPSRREMLSTGLMGAASLALPQAALGKMNENGPGIKIGVVAPWTPTAADIKFYQQLGIQNVYANYTPGQGGANVPSVDDLKTRKQIWADAGIHMNNVRWFSGSPTTGSMDTAAILLGLPNRNEAMERCKTFVKNYGAAGFGYTIATVSVTGVWYTGWGRAGDPPALTRDTVTRIYDAGHPEALKATTQPAGTKPGADTLMYGRVYPENEVLANYRKFCDELRPVLEDSGVFIGFHPDDPPAYKSFGGVARINSTFDQIQRNIDIANSPNLGITFCLGVWLEGGKQMGIQDPVAAFKKFNAEKKVFSINFRNVTDTMPVFTESFMDNGYYDMYQFMKALIETDYNGFLEQDHTLVIDGSQRAYTAFSAGYERALYQRAMRELGKMK